jgi:hypothetical protein
MNTFSKSPNLLILVALIGSVCTGCSNECYGDVALPAGSSWDTGGETEKSCPSGFTLVKVVQDEESWGNRVDYYCIEEC